ncbi:MAG: glycosyltransferase family 4 protein, partial [Candidatus Humimicrobiaceae bacterium]
MKLIVVTPYFYPKIGGMENYAYNICKSLKKSHNWEVVVITSNHEKKVKKEEIIDGIKIYRLPFWFKISNTPINPMWLVNIHKILRKELPDIINVHSPVPFISDVTSFIERKIPIITTYHSGSMIKPLNILNPLIALYEFLFLPMLFRNSKKIICSSPVFFERNLKRYKAKVNYIPPGVDMEVFKPSEEASLCDVLYVGRIEKNSDWKGISYLLKAISIAKRTKQDISLRLVGSGDRVEHFKMFAQKLGINTNIRFMGPKINNELALEYQHAKVIVLPSITEAEAFGMVLIEAMNNKKPVIGSHIGGIPYVIDDGENGILVSPKDPEALADAIIKIIKDPVLAKKMGENGYKKVKENFTWDMQIKKTKKLIEECLNKKMKIIHITPFYPPHLGGMENVVKEISENLAKRGHQVTVFTSDIGCKKDKLISTKNIKIHYLKSFEIAHTPIIPSLFFELLKITKNSIIHLHVAQSFTPEIVSLISKIKNIPYVAHIHIDVGPSGKLGFLLPLYKKVLLKKVLNSSSKIVVPSGDYVDLVSKKYEISNNKIYKVPNGVDLNNFKSLPFKLNDPIRLLYVGRLSKQKNIPLLIRTFKIVTEKINRNIELDIVGDGEEKGKIITLIKAENLENKVNLRGELRGERLYEIYSNSDIFILTSDYESFGMVLIEAMASGLPIIASNIPALRNVVENDKTGLLVKLEPEDFAKAIEKLINNPQLKEKLIKNGLEEVKRYNWDEITKKFEDIYEEVLNEN